MAFDDLSFSELEELWEAANEELDRRRTLATAKGQIEEIEQAALAAEGIKDGEPWRETVLGYPVGHTVTHPLPDSDEEGTWTNTRPRNPYAPGSEGGGWELRGPADGKPPLWVQPAYAAEGEAYSYGQKVTFPTYEDGKVYRSIHQGWNTWAPDVYGWEREDV